MQVQRHRIEGKLGEHGQQHVLCWLEELDEEGRGRLLRQLQEIDFDQLDRFRGLIDTPTTDVDFSDVRPAPVDRLPLTEEEKEAEEQVRETGHAAFRADRVAAVMVAGGQGTRLGYDHPKGMFPVSPVRGRSLFGIFAEKILAARRRYGCSLPWLIMTSLENDEETREFFDEQDFFGLGRQTVHFFPQGVNPILDEQGRLLRAEPDELLVGPGGHGATFAALERNGMFEVLREGGYDLISYFQVDNPLVTVADERYLGHHLRKDADFSCKVIAKRNPQEGLGIAVLKGGHPAIIEYVDVPDEIASRRSPNGKLEYRYGSIAIHAVSTPFAEQVARDPVGLPWHVAQKQYEIIDESGRKVESGPDACYKFEQFIFDGLQFAEGCAFVEVQRETEFAPVKNAEGKDSPRTARELMQRQWLRWLQQAGADFEMPEDLALPVLEISPLYAADAEELKEKTEPGWQPEFPLVLAP